MEDIKISVYCMSYNCAPFIERAIHGMVSQKINVSYKIIIHDDASTDGSADIIRKYAKKYPEKICAVFQSENQYSKGADIYKQFISPHIEGDYIAICEGDDFWMDENKLQMQYDYMEKHPECSLCTHNTVRYDLNTKKKSTFNNWKDVHILTADEVFANFGVHTSSYFLRKACKDWPGKTYWFGDYMMLTWAFYLGQVAVLPYVMSVYHAKNPNGVMSALSRQDVDLWIKKIREQTEYLNQYNELTRLSFKQYVQNRIECVDYSCVQRECDHTILHSDSKTDSISAAKRISSHKYYVEYLNDKKGLQRLIRRYRYEGYFFYPLWKLIMKKSIRNRL